MIKKSAKKYEKEKYVENQTQKKKYRKIMQCDCYMKNADTKKIKKVK